MSNIILKIENVSKQYRLGVVGTGTLSHDLNRWWHKLRGKEDPYIKIGDTNRRDTKGDSDYVWALKDISFEVKRGEVLGIIGKNGAGKSTLLKILSQVTAPTTGIIKSKGRIASLLEVGTGFHPELTGKENIYLNGAILGMTKAEIAAKFDEIVEFSGVARYVDTPVKRYSSGMKVRLAFAVAAHLEPEILVVDEVLAVGDAEFQKKAIGKMQDISKGEGRTVLFVSHSMGAVKQLCTRGIVLENGMINFDGGIEEAINRYVNRDKTQNNLSEILATGIKNLYIENENSEIIEKVFDENSINLCFEIENNNEFKSHSLGYTIFDSDNNSVFSSYLKDGVQNIPLGNLILKSKIPISNLNIGTYYVEYNYNGKNLENALTFEKMWCKSNFVMQGNKSKSRINLVDWELKQK